MPQVDIVTEEESPGSWTFVLRVNAPGAPAERTLHLSWADYNLWSADGADPPHAVARAVVEFLLKRMPVGELPARIDAGLARRRFPDADREIPGMIRKE